MKKLYIKVSNNILNEKKSKIISYLTKKCEINKVKINEILFFF